MRAGVWGVFTLALACSGEQRASPASGGDAAQQQTAPAAAQPAAAPETAAKAGAGAPTPAPRVQAGDTSAGRDSAAKTAKSPGMAERPLRDSAFGPKFTVDSTGKARPIKKP